MQDSGGRSQPLRGQGGRAADCLRQLSLFCPSLRPSPWRTQVIPADPVLPLTRAWVDQFMPELDQNACAAQRQGRACRAKTHLHCNLLAPDDLAEPIAAGSAAAAVGNCMQPPDRCSGLATSASWGLRRRCTCSKEDPRRYLHTALWPVQLLIWAALLGVTFAMPNGVFVVWGQVTPSSQPPSACFHELIIIWSSSFIAECLFLHI